MFKGLKKGLSLVMATAMVVTGVNMMPGASFYVHADCAIADGDFENVNDTWHMGWSTKGYDTSWNEWPDGYFTGNWLSASDGAKRSGEKGLGVYFSNNSYVTLYQTLNLEAGTYSFSGYAKEVNTTESTIKFTGTGLSGDALEIASEFGEFTGTLTLDEANSAYGLTVQIEGAAGAWVCLDDITISQTGSSAPADTPETTPETTPDVTKEDLQKLADLVPADISSATFSSESARSSVISAKNAALGVIENGAATSDEISAAYDALETSFDALTYSSGLFVTKLSDYDASSIRGVDVSSYVSIMNAFDYLNAGIENDAEKHGFRDFDGNLLTRQGFFDLLAASGVNYVRTRVWVDPKDASGKGYGGGNNDVAIAKEIATYVSNAGMKNLIDFHLSDLWTDPGKQRSPKAWQTMTIDEKAAATAAHITSALTEIESEGATVSMVQVGNETNNGVAGENTWVNMDRIFDAGCDAVHAFATANGRTKGEILAAVHFADPQQGKYPMFAQNLADYDGDGDGTKEGVSYDVFASSYYPFFHGELANLQSVLSDIASTYDKYVMVAETSWPTSLEDADGHANQVRPGNNDQVTTYAFTVQGQANEIRAVANAMNGINVRKSNGNRAALGFFYWEPAWIAVQNISELTGADYDAALAQNRQLWEQFGCGWASSFGGEYGNDERDWYGGSAMDNQAVFDFDGKALESINTFKYLLYGSVSTKRVDSYTVNSVVMDAGETLALPENVSIRYNDGDSEDKRAIWDEASVNAVDVNTLGNYAVTGHPEEIDDYQITTVVTVEPVNLLTNGGFEGNTGWSFGEENAGSIKTSGDDATGNLRRGNGCYHFWSENAYTDSLTQTVHVDKAGKYTFTLFAQGSGATVQVSLAAGTNRAISEAATLNGYKNWHTPEAEITVSTLPAEGVDIIVRVDVIGNANAWGALDDAKLYVTERADSNTNNAEVRDQTTTQQQNNAEVTDGTAKKTEEQTETYVPTRTGNTSGSYTGYSGNATVVSNTATVTEQSGSQPSSSGTATVTADGVYRTTDENGQSVVAANTIVSVEEKNSKTGESEIVRVVTDAEGHAVSNAIVPVTVDGVTATYLTTNDGTIMDQKGFATVEHAEHISRSKVGENAHTVYVNADGTLKTAETFTVKNSKGEKVTYAAGANSEIIIDGFFNAGAESVTNRVVNDAKTYYAGEDGVIVKNSVITLTLNKKGRLVKSSATQRDIRVTRFVAGKNGVIAKSKITKIGKNKYYSNKNGVVVTSKWVKVKGKKYYCSATGIITKVK